MSNGVTSCFFNSCLLWLEHFIIVQISLRVFAMWLFHRLQCNVAVIIIIILYFCNVAVIIIIILYFDF